MGWTGCIRRGVVCNDSPRSKSEKQPRQHCTVSLSGPIRPPAKLYADGPRSAELEGSPSGWMSRMTRIEDYALIGDCETAALVGRDGSIDWLCLPRFDSDSCFAKLLGEEQNGYWKLCPEGRWTSERRYRPGTLI